jgi:peptidoglycan/LPS O-acetylase OafA/YrhL
VISGYLIAGLIGEEIRQKRFSIVDFYERRVRRLFPALFGVLFFSVAVSCALLLPRGLEEFGKSLIAATLFVANLFFYDATEYFAAAADTLPLLHTWSLAVEEQFYLFFPLILLFVHKWLPGRWISSLLVLALLSLGVSEWWVQQSPSAAFYLIPARAWELLLGSLLALGLLPPIRSQPLRNLASVLGFALVCWAIFQFGQATPFPGLHALIPCVGAALIIHAGVGGSSWMGRALGTRPAVFFGLISYSLYLWHWPLMVFAKQLFLGQHDAAITAGVVTLSVAMATLSWRYIERPFRKKHGPEQRRRLFAGAAAIMLLSVSGGYAIQSAKGWPTRFGEGLVSIEFDMAEYKLGSCFLDKKQHFSEWQGKDCFVQTHHPTNTLLWGDSFAAHYMPGIQQQSNLFESNLLQYTATGCAPAFGYDPAFMPRCKAFTDNVKEVLAAYDIRTVILSAAWALAARNGLRQEDLQRTVRWLREQGLRVVVIGQSPRFDRSVQDIDNLLRIRGREDTSIGIRLDLAATNAALEDVAGAKNFVDPSALFCEANPCTFRDGEEFLFWGDGHLTRIASDRAAAYIFSKLRL